MGLYGVRQLTPRQQTLAERVCNSARTLPDRLRVLKDLAWGPVSSADVDAVRGWLFEVHRDDLGTTSRGLVGSVNGAQGAA
jgi:hypothetical protein